MDAYLPKVLQVRGKDNMWQKPSLLLTNWAKRPEEYSIILKGGKVAIEPAELLADRTRMTL